jgi:hypothetical protein
MVTKNYLTRFSKDKLIDDLFWNISATVFYFATTVSGILACKKLKPESGQDDSYYFTKSNWKGGLYLPLIILFPYETIFQPFYWTSRFIRETRY